MWSIIYNENNFIEFLIYIDGDIVMKNCIKVLFFLLILFISSCKKDDSNPTTPSTGTIQGKVTNAAGDTVIVNALVTTTPPTSSVTTNANGEYIISDVPAGEYTVTASKGEYNSGSVTITIIAGRATTADIHLSHVAGNNPPNSPSLLSPADGSTNQTTTLTLSWNCTDPDGDPLKYDIYFGKTTPPSSLVFANQDATTLLRSGLDTNVAYYWQVVAKDNRGASTSGNVWQFSTVGSNLLTQGLVAHYPFNGNTNDESGNGNNGTVYGATPTTDRFGNPNRAYSFNGVDNYINLGTQLSTYFTLPFTINLWIYKPTRYLSTPGNGEIIMSNAKYQNDSRIKVEANFKFFAYRQTSNVQIWHVQANNVIDTSRWEMHTLVNDGTNMSLYSNGIRDTIANAVSMSGFNLNPGIPWYIGKCPTFTVPGPFTGEIDDIRIYNRALNETEIQALYHESDWK